MEKNELEHRIKELEIELSYLNATKYDSQKSVEREPCFRNLVEQANHPILILKGEDMILELANDALFKIWNVGKEALGKPFLEILPEMKDQPFMGLLLDVLHNRATHYRNQPTHFTRANGEKETVYFNFVYQPYKENDGTVSGVLVFANDVTEQVLAFNELEENESNFRQLAELMPQKISQAKADGNIFYYNQNWLSYSGLSIEELKDNGWVKITHPDEQDEIAKQWQHSVKTGNNFEMETRLLNKKGEYKWHLSRASTVRDDKGNIVKWLGVATEIQKQKDNLIELEKTVVIKNSELVVANKELVFQNTEKEKRAEELVVANKELVFQNTEKEKRAEELVVAKENEEQSQIIIASKQQFLANMSHEIRTPMTAIIGFSKVVLKTDLTAQQREYIAAIKTSGDSLLYLPPARIVHKKKIYKVRETH